MYFIGVDPGVSGGVALLEESGKVWGVWKMPDTPTELIALFGLQPTAYATVERVHSMPGQGHSGAFTFGRGVGRIETALAAAHIPFDLVSPVVWQRALSCLSKGDKNVTKRRAAQLFPELIVTHAFADALLLAEYGRRVHRGILPQKAARSHVQEENSPKGQPIQNGSPEQDQRFRQALGEVVRSAQRSAESAAAGDGTGPRSRARSRV